MTWNILYRLFRCVQLILVFPWNQLVKGILVKSWVMSQKTVYNISNHSFIYPFNHSKYIQYQLCFKLCFGQMMAGHKKKKACDSRHEWGLSGNLHSNRELDLNEISTEMNIWIHCAINAIPGGNQMGRHSWGCVYVKQKRWRDNTLLEAISRVEVIAP